MRTGPNKHLEAPLERPVLPNQLETTPTHPDRVCSKRGAAVAWPGPHQPSATATPLRRWRTGIYGIIWVFMDVNGNLMGFDPFIGHSQIIHSPPIDAQRHSGIRLRTSTARRGWNEKLMIEVGADRPTWRPGRASCNGRAWGHAELVTGVECVACKTQKSRLVRLHQAAWIVSGVYREVCAMTR